MNKELIKKYKMAFEHWLNGGEILHKDEFNNWENSGDIWNLRTEKVKDVIINDKYVELRKAVTKGKKIEILDTDGQWKDSGIYNSNSAFIYPLEDYRIKKKEK